MMRRSDPALFAVLANAGLMLLLIVVAFIINAFNPGYLG